MKMLFIILSLVLIMGFSGFVYYGGLIKIKPIIKASGGEIFIYKSIKGDYKQSGLVSDKVYWDLINNFNITTYKGAGIYYDNPKEVLTEELRSDIGCILENQDKYRIKELEKLFKIEEIPNKKYLVIEFPYKGKLSVLIGLLKVYPILNKYTETRDISDTDFIMEIWDIPNKKIIYRKNTI